MDPVTTVVYILSSLWSQNIIRRCTDSMGSCMVPLMFLDNFNDIMEPFWRLSDITGKLNRFLSEIKVFNIGPAGPGYGFQVGAIKVL